MAMKQAETQHHIMEYTRMRAVNSMWALLVHGIRHIHDYNMEHTGLQLSPSKVREYMLRRLVFAVVFGFGGDLKSEDVRSYGEKCNQLAAANLPVPNNAGVSSQSTLCNS